MHAVLSSFLIVASAEMGDRTQILALMLSLRFKRPWAVFFGVFVATLLNHAVAAGSGSWISSHLSSDVMRYVLAASFFGFAAWVLIPDEAPGRQSNPGHGAFVTTVTTFFLAEIGDKTQVATIALAAHYRNVLLVTLGTTAGMLFSNAFPIFFGERITRKLPMRWIHYGAAVIYFAFGIAVLVRAP